MIQLPQRQRRPFPSRSAAQLGSARRGCKCAASGLHQRAVGQNAAIRLPSGRHDVGWTTRGAGTAFGGYDPAAASHPASRCSRCSSRLAPYALTPQRPPSNPSQRCSTPRAPRTNTLRRYPEAVRCAAAGEARRASLRLPTPHPFCALARPSRRARWQRAPHR